MNCDRVILEISNYIDGDVDVTMKREIELHLEHCRDCTMVVIQTKLTVEVFCDSQVVEHAGAKNQDHPGLVAPRAWKPAIGMARLFLCQTLMRFEFCPPKFNSRNSEGPLIFVWPEVYATLIGLSSVERCPSGLRSTLGKRVLGKLNRRFESCPLRHPPPRLRMAPHLDMSQ